MAAMPPAGQDCIGTVIPASREYFTARPESRRAQPNSDSRRRSIDRCHAVGRDGPESACENVDTTPVAM
jgi:hypothetical protein